VAPASVNSAPLVFGNGVHTYELVRGWWNPPASLGIGFTHGVVEDDIRLQYFSLDGNPLGALVGNFRYPARECAYAAATCWFPIYSGGRVSKWRRVAA
jgi:hypothetical protein